MSEHQSMDDQTVPSRRKRRLLLKIAAAVFAFILVIVLIAPTLLSTKPAVDLILGQVNKQLNGKVEIASVSLGWFTDVKLQGLRVIDANGSQIAALDHATVAYPLRKAITGNLAFGDIVIGGLSFDAKLDANGKLNFAQLVKPTSLTAPGAPPSPATESKPSRLPNISGNLKLTDCRGSFYSARATNRLSHQAGWRC